MKFTTALLVAAFCAASPALAQSTTAPATTPKPAPQQPGAAATAPAEKLDPAKEQAIRHLLDLTEISKMGDNISQAISHQVQEAVGRGLAADAAAPGISWLPPGAHDGPVADRHEK